MAAAAGGGGRDDGWPAAARTARACLDLFRRSVRQSPRDHLPGLHRRRRAASADARQYRPGSVSAVKDGATAGELLLALVDRVSHRGGDTLALMNEAGTTLPQILFLARLRQAGGGTASDLADTLNMSLPAV